jgi:hypothetical protein
VHPLYSLLNLFRVSGVDPARDRRRGIGLGSPRTDPHRVSAAQQAITLHWPPTPQRQVAITLRFTVTAPSQIDVDVEVQAEATYQDFEVFLAGYYHPDVEPYVYLARANFELSDEPGRFADEPELVPVVVNDVFRGGVLAFPRDEPGARILLDGRWDGIVRFSPMRYFKVPVCFQADARRRVAVVWMARPEQCFAVATGYHGPDTKDRFKYHNPQYLSFFGDAISPGEVRRARARLVVAELGPQLSEPLALYERFLREDGDGGQA